MTKPKIYSSFTELAAAQGDFIPMHGETPTDNPIAGAIKVAEEMENDAIPVYESAFKAAVASEIGDFAAGHGIMTDPFVVERRNEIISGIGAVAEELEKADATEEFNPSASSNFAEDMQAVYDANHIVKKGLRPMIKAEIRQLDVPVPSETKSASVTVEKYAEKAARQRPTEYTDDRKERDRRKHVTKQVKKQMNRPTF